MPLSTHQASAAVFIRSLRALSAILDKAAAHAEAKKIEPAALLQARLFPDMFSFTRQVQIATDFAKGSAARLAGVEIPAWEDNEDSFETLKARVEQTIAFLEGLEPATFDGGEDRDISLTRRGETTVHKGADYLLHQAMPNFYFHLTTAYALLRHNGVEVGKRDFIGKA